MKKLFLISILSFFASVSFAQKAGTFYIQESNSIGSFEKDWGCNIYDVNFSYLWDIKDIVHLGVGAGVGVSNPIKYYSSWKINTEMNQTSFTLPLFAKLKIDFSTKPTYAYFAAKVGTRIAKVDGYDGYEFNPFTANVTPAIGVNINVGSVNNLFIEAGLDLNFSKYQQIEYAYDTILDKYIYDDLENKTDGAWAGLYLSVGFGF